MNRTVAYFATAGALALVAILAGLPQRGSTPGPKVGPVTLPTPDPAVSSTDGSIKMTGRLSHPYVMPGTQDLFVTVDLTGVEVPGADRAPVNLALVIDRSGSMSGYKLEQAKNAARHLVEQLRESDRLAIVHYGSDVKSLPSQPATPANREKMLRYIAQIWDDGGTNIGAGLERARAQLAGALSEYKVNRVILISDGQPTEGVTDERSLAQLSRSLRQSGLAVSAIGVGEDFNEDLMQAIAENGAGAYAFLQDAAQLATIFQKDLQRAGTLVARNVELSFELPEDVELGEVLGYRATQAGKTVRVAMPDFSAGQLERVVARLRVRAGAPGSSFDVTALKLDYSDLLKDGAVSTRAQLAAMVTERKEEVASRRDKDATVFATRALKAQNMERAAQALQKGDRAEAERSLQANAPLLQDAAAVAGAEAMADDLREQQEVVSGFGAASAPAEINVQVKAAKAKSLRGYGKVGSVY